jgi:pyruvate/2-oxoglutarate/acetoin dehydrogenase E1 component
MLNEGISSVDELDELEKEAKATAKAAKEAAWRVFNEDIQADQRILVSIFDELIPTVPLIASIKDTLEKTLNPLRMDSIKAAKKAIRFLKEDNSPAKEKLVSWIKRTEVENYDRFSSHLYSQSRWSAIKVEPLKPSYSANSFLVDGREVLKACFDAALQRDPLVFALGEDVGKIGDVNQGFAGLQEKYGELRVTDTGIRECTIVGQGIGAALRGLRPIAEIQYLDYLLYALQILSDDLANLQYRTKGGQKAPLIIRTRGHRLEGVWHAGSPMGMILHSLRGIFVLVPRDMTQAAGFYNTMLQSDDAALIIECLNGYRLKEKLPDNIGEFTVPLGIPEMLREGSDVTVVTYGSMCRIVMEAAEELEKVGISCEVIDVQTLLPFDIYELIVESLKKTNRIVFADEDVPGGATAFMLQKVLEEQNGYQYLDAKPVTITAKEHRPAYGSDGDYFSKPNAEEVFEKIYQLMHLSDSKKYPDLY